MSRSAPPVDAVSEHEATAHWRIGARDVWLPTSDEMARIDADAVASGATSERVLIETAGREIARQIQSRWPPGHAVALAGSGHNGADALVALRTLQCWGWRATAVACGKRQPEPDVLVGWEVERAERGRALDLAAEADVVIDGLLGTGARGAPRGELGALIEGVNALGRPVVAVDGPSGADFTTGEVAGACIRARLTVSLGWPKIGLLMFPARRFCGELVAVEIGFPPPAEPPRTRAITGRWVRSLLRPRAADAHKGDAGYLTIVAGQQGMAGAAVLAGRAAGRAGAGIVRIVSDPTNREIVQRAVPDTLFGRWDSDPEVREAVEWADALVVGPGLGREPSRRRLVESVLEWRGDRPLLLDADGISVWPAGTEELAARLQASDAVTPHPGELARLLGAEVAEVQADPPARARSVAHTLGCAVLLKGAPSMVALPSGELRVATTGGPGVASGGSGDVLSGASGAFLAAGYRPADALSIALFLTGLSAGSSPNPVGHLASDVPDALPRVRTEVEALGPPADPSLLFGAEAVDRPAVQS